MYKSLLLTTALAAANANAAPTSSYGAPANSFSVSNFSFGCTVTCDWSFDVTNPSESANHPAFTTPVHCEGSTELTAFDSSSCSFLADDKQVAAYIDKDNNLQLQYKYSDTAAGATYWYEGAEHVNAVTSGKPQAEDFTVAETRAYAVA